MLLEREPDTGTRHTIFVDGNDMIKALHVGDAEFSNQDYSIFLKLIPDITISVRPWTKELLEHHRLFCDTGLQDIIVAYTCCLSALHFNAAEQDHIASRWPRYVDEHLTVNMTTAAEFTEVLVMNAGHLVSTDQPAWALGLINKFTRDGFNIQPKFSLQDFFYILLTVHHVMILGK
jgi:vitellogenic carboxypeptidase-like protein